MSERLHATIRRIVDAIVGPRIDRCALYPGRVVAQDGDGRLEVQLDDPRWPSLTRVPIRLAWAQGSLTVQPGARVLVGWEAADPARPYAALWESGTLSQAVIGNPTAAQFVALANLVKARLDAIQATFDAHVHTTTATVGTGPVGTISAPTSTIGALASVAATKVKAE